MSRVIIQESVLDTKISDSGLIEEIDDTITPRTEATKQQLDDKLRLAETVNKYELIVSQLERDVITQVRVWHVCRVCSFIKLNV